MKSLWENNRSKSNGGMSRYSFSEWTRKLVNVGKERYSMGQPLGNKVTELTPASAMPQSGKKTMNLAPQGG